MPENVLEDAREAAVLLAASFMPRRREMLQMAVRQGRFDVLPALLRVHDNCHDEEFGLTAAQTAALTSHVASVCVLAKHDITTLYDQGVRRNTAYDVLFSVLCDKLVVTDPDNLTPACIYTYGENAACSLGHASSASIVSPTPIELGVKIVKDCTISLGRYHTLFLIDGIVYSCGLGRDGKLGHGNESDVLVPQEVFLGNRRVVAISAGPNHSVICTKKEVIVFGRNECGQLGIDAANALSPTIAYVLKKPNAEITECFAGATFSAVLTSQGQCIACGSLPWDSSRPSEFIVSLNAIFAQHTVHFFDKCVVGLQVDVLSSRGGFSTRLSEQYECEGVIETSPLVILLKSFGKDWQEPVFCVVYQHPETDVVICVEVNFVTNEPFASIQLQSVQLSPHGEFVAVSPNFIIYEGCINEDAILSSSSHEPTSKCRVCVELNRVVGLPPAMKAFISTDGRNKALLTYTIPADKLVTLQERTSTTSAIEETGETGESVEVVCLDREGKEVEVFKARRNALIEESDYCKTFFFRWCETENQVKHISFFEEASLVATFLRYCERSLQLNELTKQEVTASTRILEHFLVNVIAANSSIFIYYDSQLGNGGSRSKMLAYES
ncbi:unnamed protein product [Toxocara canis]|uniref:ANK_REP_REGION domain-containing protein n=1 Tax=Toxocara canis TaxID=6265 RepID=A0A183TY21_TOXCA|nr:unnamed protein product [Toxocara canis]